MEATKLLTHVWKIRTDSKSCRPREIKAHVDFLQKQIREINGLANVNYTSSAVVKILTTSFLAFGPMMLKEILTWTVFE